MRNTPPIYTDLFDDGITSFNFLNDELEGHNFERRLLDTVRFQVLIAILFDRQIVVPECWLASSSLFLRIFNEVDRNYPSEVIRRDVGGGVEVQTTYPFSFVFFDQPQGALGEHFVRMLSSRMSNARRVLWMPSEANQDRTALSENRAALARGLDGLLARRSYQSERDAVAFAQDMSDLMTEVFGSSVANDFSAITIPISRIIHRLQAAGASRVGRSWGPRGLETQRNAVAQSVNDVSNTVFADKLLFEQHPSQTAEFRSFFEEARASGKRFADVMGMWPILRNYDKEVQETAEAFGRLALNRGYAESTGSAQGTLSFNFYSQGGRSDFTQALLRKTLDRHTDANLGSNSAQFIEAAPTGYYDLADTIDWNGIWETAADIAKDKGWQSERVKIEDRIIRPDDDNDFGGDAWNELFDAINAKFHDIKFELMEEKSRPAARILRRELSKRPLADKTLETAAVGIGLAGFTSVTKTFTDAATGAIGTERSLALVRKLRGSSTKDHPLFSNRDLVVSNSR